MLSTKIYALSIRLKTLLLSQKVHTVSVDEDGKARSDYYGMFSGMITFVNDNSKPSTLPRASKKLECI